MIIIIEGPDGGGKTTLAEQMSRQTGYPIIHRTVPKDDEEKKKMYEGYLDLCKSGKNAILDRCWYSELAYGPVMRDTSVLTYPQMYELERAVKKVGGMIIYCTASRAELWKRAHARGEEYITSREAFNEICENYDGMMAMPHLIPVVTYNAPV